MKEIIYMKNQMIPIVVLMEELTKAIKMAKFIIVVIVFILNHLDADASGGVEITGLRDLYQYGDTIKLKIENGTQDTIFCAGEIEFMSMSGDAWYVTVDDIWDPCDYRIKRAMGIYPSEIVECMIDLHFIPQEDNVVYCRLKVHYYMKENTSENDMEMSYVRTFKIKGIKFFQP